ncbi:hypothetical protein PS922_02229 [Pseudomonas fluorescens]|jgi:hypothetical protein|uniref:Uncharacterized protein n=1 Tax=Pseudomonas fluorescens TaxID=294 RepID=A0A5E7SFF9_PSEFL|nr:hypothetical protein PS922_02229 [Pseudomonas fluorescens]
MVDSVGKLDKDFEPDKQTLVTASRDKLKVG